MKKLSAFFFLLLVSPIVFGQLSFKVDVLSMLISGQATVVAPPFDIGTINSVFDNDVNSLARTPNINPAVITLTLPNPIRFSSSKIQMVTDGYWTIESAMNQTDIDNQTGTYHLLVNHETVMNATWDSTGFTPVNAQVIRLTAERNQCCDGYVHLSEWTLYSSPVITALCLVPNPVFVQPNTSFQEQLLGKDAYGNEYLLPNNLATWKSQQLSIATVNATGKVTGVSAGVATLKLQYQTIKFTSYIHVANKFSYYTAPTRTVNVALVIQDPEVPANPEMHFHDAFGWLDPLALAHQVADSLNAFSDGAVNYKFTSITNDQKLFTRMQGTLLSVDSMYALLSEPGWPTLVENNTQFDYNLFLDSYDFCEQSNSGAIDEVWVMAFPYGGMYESELAGENAFWYNSPPLNEGNSCIGLLPVMGYNFERTWDDAVHSFGHRVEATMTERYGGWTYPNDLSDNWEQFTAIQLYSPGKSGVGNIHFPPNGIADYDYGNTTNVKSYGDDWLRFPFRNGKKKTVNCNTWNCGQDGYMRWWFQRLPHYLGKGVDGVLNNWWSYIVDYEEGLTEEGTTALCQCSKCHDGELAKNDDLLSLVDTDPSTIEDSWKVKLFPIPAEEYLSLTVFSEYDQMLSISLYDALGRLCLQKKSAANENIDFDVFHFQSGIYSIMIASDKKSKVVKWIKE